jgi:PPP family 3-phenylpropionic acid transporter
MSINPAILIRVLYFLVFCCTASWLPVLADFCQHKGLTPAQISLVLSTTPLMMFAVQPFYGFLADRFGYKKSLLIASSLAAVSYLFYLVDDGFYSILLSTFLMSVFYNTIQPLLDSLSLQLVEKEKRLSYGSLRVAGALGWSVTGLIIGQVIDQFDIQFIFIVSSISMVLVFLCALFMQHDAEEKLKVESLTMKGALQLIKNKQLLLLLAVVVLVSVAGTSIWNFYSLYMKSNGASATLVGYGLSLQGLFEIPFFYFSARIIAKLGMRTTLLITVVATALRLVLYSVVNVPIAALPIEILHGVSWSLFWVICVELVFKLVQKELLATGQSLLYAAYYGAGAVIGNYWVGYLTAAGLSLSALFLVNAGVVMLAVILIVTALRTSPQN